MKKGDVMKLCSFIVCSVISTAWLAVVPAVSASRFDTPPAMLETYLKESLAQLTSAPELNSLGCEHVAKGKNFTPTEINCDVVVGGVHTFSEGTEKKTTVVYLESSKTTLQTHWTRRDQSGHFVLWLLANLYDPSGFKADLIDTFLRNLISTNEATLQTDAARYLGKVMHQGDPINDDMAVIWIYPRD